MKIKFWLWGIVFLAPAYFLKFTLGGIPFTLPEFLIYLAFFISLIFVKKADLKFSSSYFCLKIGIILLFSGLIISTIVNGNTWSSWGTIKGWFLAPALLFWLLTIHLKDHSDIQNTLKALYFSGVTVSLIGMGYLFFGNLTYDHRLAGIFLSPNQLAMFLTGPVFIGWFFLVRSWEKKGWKFYLWLMGTFLILINLFFTYSYGTWLAIILAFSIIAVLKKKFRWLFYFLILIFLLLATQVGSPKFSNLINEKTPSSFSSRLAIWQSAFRIIGDHPLGGIGAGNFQEEYLAYQRYFPPYPEWAVPQPHNLYLAFWLQAGISGLIGFLLIVGWLMKRLLRKINDQKDGLLAAALLGILLALLIHGLVDTPYWKNDLAFIFWIILALGLKIETLFYPIE